MAGAFCVQVIFIPTFNHSSIEKKMPAFIFLIQFRTIARTGRRGVKFIKVYHLIYYIILNLTVVRSMYVG